MRSVGQPADSLLLTKLSVLIQIGQALSANLSLEPLLDTVLREVGRLFGTTNFYIASCRPGAEEFSFPLFMERGERVFPPSREIGTGITGHILKTGRKLHFSTESEGVAYLTAHGLDSFGPKAKSYMGVPLLAMDQLVGVMAIQNYDQEGLYSKDDLDLFATIASQLGIAIRNAQLFEEAERRTRETRILLAAGRDITSSLDLGPVLERVVANAMVFLGGDSMAIFMKDETGGTFPAVATGGTIGHALKSHVVRPGIGILGDIVAKARPEIIHRAGQDPRSVQILGTDESDEHEQVMASPLVFDDETIGIIVVWRFADQPRFSEDDLAFLEGIGFQSSVAIRNALLFGKSVRAQAEAERASQAKSTFLASMSHELRTPLNSILLYGEVMRDELVELGRNSLLSDLDKIQNSGRHLLGLIDNIMDISKVEAGRLVLNFEECHIGTLMEEVVSTSRPLVERNGNRFAVNRHHSARILRTDRMRLKQVILNLLSNAGKFTKDGVVRLQIEPDTARSGFVRIEVSDTGIGLSEAQIERIFQEFAQAEDSTVRKFGGTGLGLALSRKLVTMMGGSIHVVSELGDGASFIVSVPGLVQD